jgi:hypothetical protein
LQDCGVEGWFVLHELLSWWEVHNGSLLCFDARNITHGTPESRINGNGRRIGIAFANKAPLLTRALNLAKEDGKTPWMDAPQLGHRL